MKENSIEEDIKNAEHFIKSIKTDKEYKEENGWHGYYNKEIVELARILQHILSDYKRVLKENDELKKSKITYERVKNIQIENKEIVNKKYISKQKIKDEIEELKGKLEDISRRREKSKTKEEETVLWCLEIRTDERIKTLQELLDKMDQNQ